MSGPTKNKLYVAFPKEYSIWRGIKDRCYNKNRPEYPRYGGCGVLMSEEWRSSFERFIVDMGAIPSAFHSIDRYPNKSGNYENGNCRWATRKEQQNNRNNCIMMTYNGQTKTLTEWSETSDITYDQLRARKRNGWSDEEALSQPKHIKIRFTRQTKSI